MRNLLARLRSLVVGMLPPVAKRYIHFTKFFITGTLNTSVDITLYFIFANLLGFALLASNVLSTGLTMLLSFYLNYTFVFKSNKAKHHAALLFIAVTLFNAWVVQSAVIYTFVHTIGRLAFFDSHIWTLNLLAKFAAVGTAFLLNFIGYRKIFTRIEHVSETHQ
jgi:putative flippase GtrA